MKLLIAGSRSIKDFDLSPYIPEGVELIISGGSEGIDTLAEGYAIKHKISRYILLPNYAKYGRSAPIKRNYEMVDMADIVLIIWDGISKGAKSTINYANKKSKKLILVQK